MGAQENPVEQGLGDLMGKVVVLDTRTAYIYIGALVGANEYFYTLGDADVRDSAEGHSPKEKYLLEVAMHGHVATRRRVYVRADQILSISKLADVKIHPGEDD